MLRMNVWSIHDTDGRCIGHATAFAVETAFCQFMRFRGKYVGETDIELEAIHGESVVITHRRMKYFLIPLQNQPQNLSSN